MMTTWLCVKPRAGFIPYIKAKMDDDEFSKKCGQLWDMVEQYCCSFGTEPGLIKKACNAMGLNADNPTNIPTIPGKLQQSNMLPPE